MVGELGRSVECDGRAARGTRGRRRTRQGPGLTQPEIGGEVAESFRKRKETFFLPGRLSPRELFEKCDPAA